MSADHVTTTRELFEEYRATGDRRLRNELVERHMNVADIYAKRYRSRGVPADDLRQVGLLSLVRAVERFDPDRGVAFTTYASRTVEGELKRHFRDCTWSARPPRRMQELHLEIRAVQADLEQRLSRSPTVHEIAREVDDTVDHVLEALEAGNAHDATSIEPLADSETSSPVELAVSEDPGFDTVETRAMLMGLLEHLPEREQVALRLRFFEQLGQEEIARRLDVSQSYLSRIIRRSLAELRNSLDLAAA